MYRATLGIMGVLVVAVLVGLSFAPAASATRYDIDVTKTVKGYTFHVFGWIDVDKQAKTVSGHLQVTVTNPAGVVIFDKAFDFTYTWTPAPRPITLALPGVGVVTISFSSMGGIAVTTAPVLVPAQLTARHQRLDRVQ